MEACWAGHAEILLLLLSDGGNANSMTTVRTFKLEILYSDRLQMSSISNTSDVCLGSIHVLNRTAGHL